MSRILDKSKKATGEKKKIKKNKSHIYTLIKDTNLLTYKYY